MPRLVKVRDARACDSVRALEPGDILLFHGAGGHIRSGEETIEMLGPFRSAIVGDESKILTPAGPPNTVLFRVRQPGQAVIDIITGDPFHSPKITTVQITAG
jgi:hypothetical protein